MTESAARERPRIDTDAVRANADLVQVVAQYVDLKRAGREFVGLCPFHTEKTPSFHVVPNKGFVTCFGCGAHHDVIGFVQAVEGVDFVTACQRLGADDFRPAAAADRVQPRPAPEADVLWVPLLPVPESAPALMCDNGWTRRVWNPKRTKLSAFRPVAVYDYRNAAGQLLGHVLRCEFDDGKKMTPVITWCVGPGGDQRWCIRPWMAPRPLYGLDALAAKPGAPVLLLEGEKCAAAGAGALPMYAVMAWPGGTQGIPYVDWSPLAGRDVVLWPDADRVGREAMVGWRNLAGDYRPGIAQLLARAGVRSIRLIDTTGQPKGWDIADALTEGWSPRQVAAWAAERVVRVQVVQA